MNTKVCKRCGEEKALEEFSKDSSKKDGKRSKCKVCDKAYHQANRKHRLGQQREYYQANRKHRLGQQREYYQANKSYYRDYYKERYASDPIFALARRCRRRIQGALNRKGFSKGTATAEMLGCTWEEFAAHIESRFTDGMTWDNRSDWHIDHIVPLASASTKEETVALNHYTNLQPLWAEDNLRKGAVVPQDNNCTELLQFSPVIDRNTIHYRLNSRSDSESPPCNGAQYLNSNFN